MQKFNFFKLLSGLFEFQTNFGFRTSSFRFTVVFLISKPLFGVIQGFRNLTSVDYTLLLEFIFSAEIYSVATEIQFVNLLAGHVYFL